jgi:hypothetical protein
MNENAPELAILKSYLENMAAADGITYSYAIGKRWIKVIRHDGVQYSVYAFIDPENGDMYKPAGWQAPAKHARANLFKPESWVNGCGRYSMAYLK